MKFDEHGFAQNGPLIAVGVGFGRTGTNSLQVALQTLYNQPCYHGFELITKRRSDCKLWAKLVKQLFEQPEVQMDPEWFYHLYRGYRCATDVPSFLFYKQLLNIYPEAKFILTIRDTKGWLDSAKSTIMPRGGYPNKDWAERFISSIHFGSDFLPMLEYIVGRLCGKSSDKVDDETLIEVYEKWNREVIEAIPADRLLLFDVKQGWEPLCAFLGQPVPKKPFPKLNARWLISSLWKNIYLLSLLLKYGVPILVPFLMAIGVWHWVI
ncbi:unnamed protein product [Dicrocoelium dendriticum]|nr:unnamed protein product [Dicrocoelium dendriticum]